MASASTQPRPVIESWNACAVPWKLPEIVAGNVSRATACTRATASPSAIPGRRLNESVTDGNWPVWLTDSGPTVWRVAVSYTHLRAHETRHELVCRLLLEKKK